VVDPTLGDLALLTSALDEPGTKLQDAVTASAGHLAAAVPSLLGVTITLVLDGDDVTLGIHHTDLTSIPNVPFNALITNDAMDSTMVFYAGDVNAFADLAAAVIRWVDTGGPIPTCGQMGPLSSGHALVVTGLAEFSMRNQAIGVLIDQGYLPDEARLELRRRAGQDTTASKDTVQHTPEHPTPAPNRTRAAEIGTPGQLPAQRRRIRTAPVRTSPPENGTCCTCWSLGSAPPPSRRPCSLHLEPSAITSRPS